MGFGRYILRASLVVFFAVVSGTSVYAADSCHKSPCAGTPYEQAYNVLLKEQVLGEKLVKIYHKTAKDMLPDLRKAESPERIAKALASIGSMVVIGATTGGPLGAGVSGVVVTGLVGNVLLQKDQREMYIDLVNDAAVPLKDHEMLQRLLTTHYQKQSSKVTFDISDLNDAIRGYFNEDLSNEEAKINKQAEDAIKDIPESGVTLWCDDHASGIYATQSIRAMFDKYVQLINLNRNRAIVATNAARDVVKLCEKAKKNNASLGQTAAKDFSSVVDGTLNDRTKKDSNAPVQQQGESSKAVSK